MTVWTRIQNLLEGIEKDTAGAAGSAPGGQKCKHGRLPGQCSVCSGKSRVSGAAKKRASSGPSSEEGDLKDQLESSKEQRSKGNLDFPSWNKKINDFLKHTFKSHKEGQQIIPAFKEAEKEAAHYKGYTKNEEGDIDGFREAAWNTGVSYDDYIGMIAHDIGKDGLWRGLRAKIGSDLKFSKYKRPEKDVFGAPSGEYSPADLEKDTVEFQEFEKWAREVAEAYMKDAKGNPIPYDEKSFKETLHYFASSGQRLGTTGGNQKSGVYPGGEEPSEPGIEVSRADTSDMAPEPKPGSPEDFEYWKKRYEDSLKEVVVHQDPEQEVPYGSAPAGNVQEPLYKHLMRMDRGAAATVFITQLKKNMESNKRLGAQTQQQIDQPAQMPQAPENWPPEMKQRFQQGVANQGMMIPAGEPTKQIDPELFKKKRKYQDQEKDKRKFATWWDPFGFKGNIPFSDM